MPSVLDPTITSDLWLDMNSHIVWYIGIFEVWKNKNKLDLLN